MDGHTKKLSRDCLEGRIRRSKGQTMGLFEVAEVLKEGLGPDLMEYLDNEDVTEFLVDYMTETHKIHLNDRRVKADEVFGLVYEDFELLSRRLEPGESTEDQDHAPTAGEGDGNGQIRPVNSEQARTKVSEQDAPIAPVAPPKPKHRMESYQTKSDFMVCLMVKNLKKEEVSVEFESEIFRVHAKLPDGSDYENEIHCARKINPENCTFKVLGTKLEICLRKLESGIWPALEADKAITKDVKPRYPTSCIRNKDWETLEKKLKRKEEKELAPDINSLLVKIYNSGDENVKRAMDKSMQESNGTKLSINWAEVGEKQVEIKPPEGMEFKKWK